ncbi:hypothetical protein HN873_015067 [Arachis hypogaea]
MFLMVQVFVDGTTTMSTHERKARIREFYAVIYPSLLQLQKGVTDSEDKKQKVVCMERRTRSQSWPFCRDSLKRVNSCDLWVLTDSHQSMMNHMFLLLGLYELISAKEAMINGGAEIKGLIALFHQIFYQPDPKGGLKELVDPRLGDNLGLEIITQLIQFSRYYLQGSENRTGPSNRSGYWFTGS